MKKREKIIRGILGITLTTCLCALYEKKKLKPVEKICIQRIIKNSGKWEFVRM